MTSQTPTMGEQRAARSVIEELLRQQSTTPARNGFSRLFGYSPLGDDSVSWYLGAKGELEVGGILATLPPDWTAFHALPIGKKGADIDHLVIGPGGLFTLNTKNHSGKGVWVAGRTLMVSGHRVPHIRNAEHEADRVTKLLRERMPRLAAAQPVIALVNPKSLTVKSTPERVKVVTAPGLRRWLITQPVSMGPAELANLAAIIDDPATWPTPVFPPTEHPFAQFAVLDAEVRQARVRRTLWKLLGAVVAAAVAVSVGPPLLTAVLTAFMGSATNP
ncbi:NERD domain-containing protein [Cryobacterium sp. TMT1-21]|uniref:NERD domain-containing protein n=1 Tax=Cryobacterium shii TaxID=1259235 RepID=A0AAQ2C591_9MICO|nr:MULTISPECIES: nuclease-related domain-containing protein [Cryobacterium]TFC44681.1 NERD domain-containing protein [Cryobacterium shii]TFC85670.1 NERD domain-containing protein [Cryobacterium sp. TmT2-59]TFD14589.1 NERD domain-containing protein [Cryobacterium sp. TMT1-21]TFD21912.1 NERD domain-containing protein [Cryobacterium sp. TMT4-10]TFD22765.1 NERD domain-containing protein [Cryobacterium sp. TMT2-23]